MRATALVALAISGVIPTARAAGKETSDPPPATELMAPATTEAAASKAAWVGFMRGGVSRGSLQVQRSDRGRPALSSAPGAAFARELDQMRFEAHPRQRP